MTYYMQGDLAGALRRAKDFDTIFVRTEKQRRDALDALGRRLGSNHKVILAIDPSYHGRHAIR